MTGRLLKRERSGLVRAAVVRSFVIGILATLVFGVALYHPFFQSRVLSRMPFLWTLILFLYWVVPLPLYLLTFLRHPERRYDSGSKPLLVLALVRRLRRGGWHGIRPAFRSFHARLTLLSLLVKLYYLPLMTSFFWEHTTFIVGWFQRSPSLSSFTLQDWVLGSGYSLVNQTIFLIDTMIFAFGYAVELPWLKSRIRSVEPTLLGWTVTLACYPPFNMATDVVLSRKYANVVLPDLFRATLNIGVLTCLLIYLWASIALWFKASNLTHRGIVAHGPYRFIRHPAYAAKNLSWWLESLPSLTNPSNILSIVGWNVIYILRAITEERHLKKDPAYREYCRKVRYRFIPGVV
ncbi:MAG TPA: methyltransferase [Bdellovibrionota bacterium]|nr:methyltransferase [Bdellovibrionota bacterium]